MKFAIALCVMLAGALCLSIAQGSYVATEKDAQIAALKARPAMQHQPQRFQAKPDYSVSIAQLQKAIPPVFVAEPALSKGRR